MAALQNGRILRFLIVIGAVVLTIFIYASYYSNTSLTVPSHIRASPALASSSSMPSEKNDPTYNNGINNLSNSNRLQNVDDVNNMEQKDSSDVVIEIHNIDSNLNNMKDRLKYSYETKKGKENNAGHTNDRNKTGTDAAQSEGFPGIHNISSVQSFESVLIPTSNIQTFILNADKILKNLTTFSSRAPSSQPHLDTKELHREKQPNESLQNDIQNKGSITLPHSSAGQPSSIQISGNRVKTPTASLSLGGQSSNLVIDPTQGIPTSQIYESGHLDVNPQLCPDEGESIKLLIIITSAQPHQEARLAIRQTWGHYGTRRDVAIAFILGRTNNQTLENALNHENYIYGDLIRGHFIDSYNNLTLKTISALEWVDHNCPLAKYVLKTDDDMFINVPKLMAFTDKHQKDKRVIFGRLAKKWKPIRNKKSKYYVSTGQFAATLFPPFTTGPAYVMSADIIHELYVKALQQTYLKLEDVFTTGIVAQQLGIKRIHVNEFLNRRIAFNPCNIRKTISVHMIKSNEQFDLWKKLLDQSTKCK